MIHYNNNTGKHTNIRLQKAKRHAMAGYRHDQRVYWLKGVAIFAAITVVCTLVALAITA